MSDDEIREQVNHLYWNSDASVGDIADRVGLSRRALYDAIEPQPADGTCPECGGDLGFRNRTALADREAECADCDYSAIVTDGARAGGAAAAADDASTDGAEAAEAGAGEAAEAGPARAGKPAAGPPPGARPGAAGSPRRLPSGDDPAVSGVTVLAGLAVVAVVLFIVQRR